MPLPADDLAALTDAALSTATAGGCTNAELRVERIRSQRVRLRDAAPEGSSDDTEFGMGVRVVVDGAVGFAATVDVTPAEAANLVRIATETARVTAQAGGGRVALAPEPSHGEVTWTSAFDIDPATVPLADKVALLEERSRRLLADDVVSHVTAEVLSVGEETYLADLSGTRATQRRVRCHPQMEALALGDDGFETMRTLAPPVGRGWEYADGRRRMGLGRRTGPHAGIPRREVALPFGRRGHIRPRGRSFQSVADHSRVDRACDRARPRRGIRGGIRRHVLRHVRSIGHARLWLAGHARDGRSHGGAWAGHRRHRQRGRGGAVVRPDPRRVARGVSARPLHRRQHEAGALQRMRLRRLASACTNPTHGERLVGAGRRGRADDGRAHQRRRARSLHRRRQELVHRHAALQLPVHRPTVLQDRGRQAGGAGEGRGVSSHNDRFLGLDGGRRRAFDLRAGWCVQLRQGSTGTSGAGQSRVPVGPRARRACAQRGEEAGR